MKGLIILFSLILFNACNKVAQLPYKEGSCYQEKLEFMAEGSPNMYEVYKVKKKGKDGYELGRYHKNIMFHYTKVSVENIKKRKWEKVVCPDKKPLKLFEN
jgi:hypothetical protein